MTDIFDLTLHLPKCELVIILFGKRESLRNILSSYKCGTLTAMVSMLCKL